MIAPKSKRHGIFISYCHADKRYLDDLLTHLEPLVSRKLLDPWSDQRLKPGDDWQAEIEQAIASAKIAVLLVSPKFLASRFIANKELPPLLKAAKDEGLTIFWIPVSHSRYQDTEIATYQAAYRDAIPLDTLSRPKRNGAWVEIVGKLKEAFDRP